MIKELLVVLTAEQRIEYDKMGAATYYWCLPSAATQKRKQLKRQLEGEIEELQAKRQKIEDDIKEALIGKEQSDERKQKLELYSQLQQQKSKMAAEKARYAEFDPKLISKIESDVQVAKDAANRWTDAILTFQSHCTRKLGIDAKAFNQNFEIPEDFDNL